MLDILRGFLGILLIIAIAFLLSNNKKKINWRLVGAGLGLQLIFAILIIKGDTLREYFFPLGWVKDLFTWISGGFVIILNFTTEGAFFVFDKLALGPGDVKSIG